MIEKEERNNEGRERGERMRDNISESPLNILKARDFEISNFFRKGCAFLKTCSPT